jgi:hypothetical protein
MHDTPHGAAAARAHSSNTAPATLLQLYERFSAQRHAVFSSARAMPQGESHLLLPLDKAWGGQQSCKLKGTASMNCHWEVCGCFAQHLAWVHVHLKLLPSNAWSCLGARGSTWRTWCRLPQECRSAGVAFLLSCRYVYKEHMVCVVGILVFTAMWALKCVWKVES